MESQVLHKALHAERYQELKHKIKRMQLLEQVRVQAVPALAAPADGIVCQRCGNTGWITAVGKDGYDMAVACPACYERRQVVRRLKHSGISAKDYARYTLQRFDAKRSEISAKMKDLAVRYLDTHYPGGPGFGVFGSSGVGKTHICIAVCQKLTRRYHEPHFYFSYRTEMPELVKALKSYNDEYDKVLAKWKTCENLYIDDLFKLAGNVENGHLVSVERQDLRVMFDIINARYLNHKTTLFSSEYAVKDITKIDGALGSRIYEMTAPYGIYVEGKNQRLASGKQEKEQLR